MNKKITISVLVVIVVISVGSLFINFNEDPNAYITKTDPRYFTNPDYNDAIHARYMAINPIEVKEISDIVFSGTIDAIETNSVLMGLTDPEIVDEYGNVIEPRIDIITYTININQTNRGDIGRIIDVQSQIPSKIDFQVRDEVFVMAVEDAEKEYFIMSGPFGIYKILGDEAIGHEFTLPKHVLAD